MNIYGKERPLFWIALAFSLLFWLVLIVATFGIALIYLGLGFFVYLFVQSAFISWLRGNGVKVTPRQFPELHARVEHCCRRLGISPKPEVYLVNSEGMLNALATKFLGDHFIVLYSEVVEALEDRPEALNFYIAHELGHIKQRHLNWGPVLWPGMLLPHLGTAYSRAREYTCDLYGLACCDSLEDAERALAVLASGDSLWKRLDLEQYRLQVAQTGGFWMSFHEYTGDYPWLVKRLEHVRAAHLGQPREVPRRSFFAFLLACFVPRTGAGGGAGLVVLIAVLGIFMAIALPAYQDYTVRARVSMAYQESAPVREHLRQYYLGSGEWPASLEEAGYYLPTRGEVIETMYLDADQDLVIRLNESAGAAAGGEFYFTPYLDENDEFQFRCGNLSVEEKYLPMPCR